MWKPVLFVATLLVGIAVRVERIIEDQKSM